MASNSAGNEKLLSGLELEGDETESSLPQKATRKPTNRMSAITRDRAITSQPAQPFGGDEGLHQANKPGLSIRSPTTTSSTTNPTMNANGKPNYESAARAKTFPRNTKLMIKSHSESSYLGRKTANHRKAPGARTAESTTGSGVGSKPIGFNDSNSRVRSVSLQQQHVGIVQGTFTKKPEVISLSNMPRELGLEKKSSLSFSAVGFMVESMHRLHSHITDKKPDVEQAVLKDDFTSLALLCMEDEAACSCAALIAIKEDKEEMLAEILDLFENNHDDPESERTPHTKVRPKLQRQASEGNGLLHIAVQKQAYKCVSLLLERGFSPNYWNNTNKFTPMHFAAMNGDIRTLELLTDSSRATETGNLNIGEDRDGQSVLHVAVRANQLDTVKYLLKNKANKTGKGKFTETPLHTAAEHNFHECAKVLLEEGVLVDALRGENVRETALHIAAANGYVETSELLLKGNSDANAKNSHEETPLHLAAKMHSVPVMRLLIEHGADVDSLDCEGRPPLHFAINSNLKGATECMQLLLNRGANINQGDVNGTTALHLAALNRKIRRVKLLIKNGADLCLRNKAGKSALYFVMKYVPNTLKTIEERLDSGMQIGRPEQEYETSVKMDFNLLMPSAGNYYISEVGLFTEILQMHNNDPARLEKILMHPLSLSFLHLKWQQIKWLYYIIILISHLIYSITYSVYIVSVYNGLCKPKDFMAIQDLSYMERVFRESKCDFHSPDHLAAVNSARVSWLLLIVFNLIYVARETTKFIHLKDMYFKEWESVLNLMTILSFPLISFHFNPFGFGPEDPTFSSWQFHAAGIGVLTTWILQMFLIGKVPRFGKYVQMLLNVGWSFFNFFVAYISLILGFGLSFVVLFPKEVAFVEALSAPIKVLVMMTGEIEYNDLYYPQRDTIFLNITQTNNSETHGIGYIDDEDIPQYFPITAHAILTIFIIVVAIVIMNLLFGMAVSDVQELYKKSRLHQSIQQVHLISYMESILFSPLFYKLPSFLQKFLRRKLHGLEGKYRNVWEYEPESYKGHRALPSHLNKSIKDKCDELSQKRGTDASTLKNLHQTIRQLESKLDNMHELLQKLCRSDGFPYSNAPTLSMDDDDDVDDDEDSLSDDDPSSHKDQSSLNDLDESDFMDSSSTMLTSSPNRDKLSVTYRLSQINEEDQVKSEESPRSSRTSRQVDL